MLAWKELILFLLLLVVYLMESEVMEKVFYIIQLAVLYIVIVLEF